MSIRCQSQRGLSLFLTVVRHFVVMLAVCGFLSLNFVSFASAAIRCSDLAESRPRGTSRRADERVLAVHLTDFFPADGFVRASQENRGRFGVTLHFALGQPVIDHAWGKWSERRYGIVLPLGSMKKQLLNLFAQDTFVLGDLKLPAETVLFVPTDEIVPQGLGFKVVRYDRTAGIKPAIDRYIEKSGTLKFQADASFDFSKVQVDGRELDLQGSFQNFFAELLTEKPSVTTTSHGATPWGSIDYKVIEVINRWFRNDTPKTFQINKLFLVDLAIKDSLIEVSRIAKQMDLPEHARKSLNQGLVALGDYLNLLDVELALRKEHGKSILETDFTQKPELHRKFVAALGDRVKLKNLALEEMGHLKKASDIQLEFSPRELAYAMRNSPLDEVKRRMAEHFPNPEGPEKHEIEFSLLSKAVNLLMRGQLSAEVAIAELKLRGPTMEDIYIGLIFDDVMNQFVKNERSPAPPPALKKFLASPELRKYLDLEVYRRYYQHHPEWLARLEALTKVQ